MYAKILKIWNEDSINGEIKNTELIKALKTVIIEFLSGEETAKIVVLWLQKGYFTDENGEIIEGLKLSSHERHRLIKFIFQYSSISHSTKFNFLDAEKKISNNDIFKRLEIYWNSSIPCLKNKEKIWKIITNPKECKLSIYDYK